MKVSPGLIIDDELNKYGTLWITCIENDKASEDVNREEAIEIINHFMSVFSIEKKEIKQ